MDSYRAKSRAFRLLFLLFLLGVMDLVVSFQPSACDIKSPTASAETETSDSRPARRNKIFRTRRFMVDTDISSGFSSSSAGSGVEKRDSGRIGQWEELNGNWVHRPGAGGPYASDEPPRALLHFLGGALVGAAPHITYRYMLESLAEKGFLIVATPYQLSFDHLDTCDSVITRFEEIAPTIAREYGALPVVGIGHSCGALLQLLITCLFPDTPRAANALMSFNNKPVTEAVPFFEEVFAPFFTSIAAKNGTFPSSNEAITLSLQLAKAATEGELPSDELLKKVTRFMTPPGFPVAPEDQVQIPSELRNAVSQVISPSLSALAEAGVLPVLNQAVVSFEQIPKLVDEFARIEKVANGARDFVPTPSATRAAARKAYRARRTLILGFSDDGLDESDQLEGLLKEAERLTRMKRPMVGVDVKTVTLTGGHATPLLAPPLDLAGRAEDILGKEVSRERLYYEQASATVDELVRWLEEGNL